MVFNYCCRSTHGLRIPSIILRILTSFSCIQLSKPIFHQTSLTSVSAVWRSPLFLTFRRTNQNMAELLLSAFLQVLFERLASRELLNFVGQLQGGVDSELQKWGNNLRMIKAVLRDAEEKELTDEAVKIWLDELQDLAYDAEDILDEFATEALKHKLQADPDHQPISTKIQSFLPAACFNCFNPRNVQFNMDMKSKIESMTNRFKELCEKRSVLGLQQVTSGGTSTAAAAQNRPPSSSVATERAVYGRNEDKAKILEMVLDDEPSDASFLVIPIVGMAGVGKTTLAREVYNDKAVENFNFDIKAWICVSDVFDVLSISKTLLTKITSKSCAENDFDEVQVGLRKAVEGKKFLLVFDDVWNENYNLWQTLGAPFMACAPNSKIIVTTRLANVASTMGMAEHHNLKLVSDEDCWSIFKIHAFGGRDMNAHQVSELLRDKVIQKCGGLPLAASTLGGLLRFNTDDAWDEILNSNIWDLSQQSGILPALRLSYHHLPAHLKRCFGYCAIFPKDYEFGKKELVLLWMAERIIQQPSNNKHVEDWGNKCFDDLVSRSIFQQSSSGNSKFVMHDLVHDLAQLVSGGTILTLEEANKLSRTLKRVRHASYIRRKFDGKNKFEVLNEVDERLRTFLPVDIRGGTDTSYITNMVLSDLLPKFKKLRAFSLAGYNITMLPNSIRELRHLNYLNLTSTKIRSLPLSTSSLLNLQILILRNCSCLIELPPKLMKLINLYHLDIKGANLLKEMPLGMKELKCLNNLSNFIVGKDSGSGLKDLKHLKLLHGELGILKLETLKDSREAEEAAIEEKQNLEALLLQWSSQFDNSRDEVVEENVLDMLRPHKNIKKLTITCYGGKRFPLWIGDPLFSKMEVLELENCENCTSLPSLGLLGSLKNLTIKGMRGLKCIDAKIYGKSCSKPFQSLETLSLENLPTWEYWDNEHVEALPRLRELSIVGCPKLSGKLPKSLPSLETIVVSNCAGLIVSVTGFPMLNKLEIDECKGLEVSSTPIDSGLIKYMTISSSSLEIYGCKGMLYNNPTDDLLKSVTISNILEFGKFLKQGFQMVDSLAIGDCRRIKSWRQYGVLPSGKAVQGLHILTDLGEISTEENRFGIVSFPEVNFLRINLRCLIIEKSSAVKSLPQELMGNNSQLETLAITKCDSLTFIAKCKLPPSLQKLDIWSCNNLQHLVVDEQNASSSVPLKRLSIVSCPMLTTLSSGLRLLEDFYISNCPKLELLPDGLHNLKEIRMYNCPGLVYLLERGLPNTISVVSMGACEKLKALPNYMHQLNSLQRLRISELPSVVSFPEEGFPNNLTSLMIEDREIYKRLIQWGLHRLTSLRSLHIDKCDEAESFPDEQIGMMLPTTLTELYVWRFPKLKYLSNSISVGVQHLTSLEYLYIKDCPNLTYFPKVGLPSSLSKLNIYGCPLLKEQCKRNKGKEWFKISHIPCVEIDLKFIYDPDKQ